VVTRGFIFPLAMELFFVLSGVGSWYALRSRTAGAYLWGRVKRLLVPLYTVGLFLLLPPQFYFELLTNRGYQGTFWEAIALYLSSIELPRVTQWPDTLLPVPFSGHLWFLQYLFLISLVTLPLLLFLKSGRGKSWITRLAGWCDRPGGVFLFLIPLALALIGLRGLFQAQRSWADFVWYTIYFVIGYVMAGDERFTGAFKRHTWSCLVLWLLAFFGGVVLLVLVAGYDPFPGRETFSLNYALYQVAWTMASWSAVVFFLGVGARYLRFNHKALAYGNEAVLPFYLFHQTVILVVGFFVIRWNMGILPKLLVVIGISFLSILALYELLVRRWNGVRFLFGMRPREKPPSGVPVGS